MDVKLDNSFVVTERVTVHYNSVDEFGGGALKGWVRAIPKSSEVKRKFESTGKVVKNKYFYDVADVICYSDNLYDKYEDENYYYLNFTGDTTLNIYGDYEESYVYSYHYHLGYDMYNYGDELYFNLMGTQNPVRTDLFRFSITMPKEFDASKVAFYKGISGAGSTPADIRYEVDGNTISNNKAYVDYNSGVTEHGLFGLNKNVGLTIRIELPEGYFSEVDKSYFANWIDILVIVLTALSVVVVIIICLLKSGKNNPIMPVEFYAPEGVNPPEATYISTGKITPKQMTSLVLYWTSKKYIRIILDDVNEPKSITKLKDLPSSSPFYEKEIFNAFFEEGKTFNFTGFNSPVNLAITKGSEYVASSVGKRTTQKSKVLSAVVGIVAILPVIALLVVMFVLRQPHEFFKMIILLAVLCVQFIFVCLLKTGNSYSKVTKGFKCFLQALLIILMFVLLAFMIPNNLDIYYIRFYVFVPLSLFYVFGMDAFKMGTSLLNLKEDIKINYGKLMGLKKNIQIMEYEQVKRMLQKDAEYFYSVLPYAYALGELDDFVKKFEGIDVPTSVNYGHLDIMKIHILCNSLTIRMSKVLLPPVGSATDFDKTYGGSGGFNK